MITIPGLVDPHVHLRDPGQTHKEDAASGTAAALAGGFTQIITMPNTTPPIGDLEGLAAAQEAIAGNIRCDVGFFAAGLNDNLHKARLLAPHTMGLKCWLDSSFGNFLLTDARLVEQHLLDWPGNSPLVVHAEGGGRFSLGYILGLAAIHRKAVHILHVAKRDEILLIRAAKEKGLPVTCETCPQYLFFTQEDLPNLDARLLDARPTIGNSQDRQALWDNLEFIDCFGSDHAPHTLTEKFSPNAMPGMPGLETSLAILLDFVHQGKLDLDDIVLRMATNPRKIFHLPEQENTFVEIDPDQEWIVENERLHTKVKWSPFEGIRLKGRVHRVVLRGRSAYQAGNVVAPPGYGRLITPNNSNS